MKISKPGLLIAAILSVCFVFAFIVWDQKINKLKDIPIQIVDIKSAAGVDQDLKPVTVLETFPKDTSKIFCWFKWRNAKVNTLLMAKWHYITDDIPILSSPVVIPRKEGMGSVSLQMPEGKMLPVGTYKVDLLWNDRPLKSLSFKIE